MEQAGAVSVKQLLVAGCWLLVVGSKRRDCRFAREPLTNSNRASLDCFAALAMTNQGFFALSSAPAANNQQPTTSNQQPATSNQQPATNEIPSPHRLPDRRADRDPVPDR
jgi:hypothetical protein